MKCDEKHTRFSNFINKTETVMGRNCSRILDPGNNEEIVQDSDDYDVN